MRRNWHFPRIWIVMEKKYFASNRGTCAINILCPSDAIWWHKSGSTLALVMGCCLMAPNLYLSQHWLIMSQAQGYSSEGNFTSGILATNHYNQLEFLIKKLIKISKKISKHVMLFSCCHCSHNHNCGIVVPPADIPNHDLIDASVPLFQVTSVNIYVLLIIFCCVCYSYASNEYNVFSFYYRIQLNNFVYMYSFCGPLDV